MLYTICMYFSHSSGPRSHGTNLYLWPNDRRRPVGLRRSKKENRIFGFPIPVSSLYDQCSTWLCESGLLCSSKLALALDNSLLFL